MTRSGRRSSSRRFGHLEVQRKVGVLTVSEGGFRRRTTIHRAPNKWANSRKMTPEELAGYGEPSPAPTRDNGS
jgi:hypothetical protein